MALVNVNSFLAKAESSDLKIDAVKSSELYKDATFLSPSVLNCIKRFETNVKISADSGENLYLSDFQLFDKDEIDFIHKSSKKYKYIHVGVILVAIRALFPNFEGKKGRIVVYDGSCIDNDKSQAFIAADEFTFSNDTCYFAIRPRHIFSTTDVHIADMLRFNVDLDCPKYAVDRELVALDIGVAYRMCNASRFLDTRGSNWTHQSIEGCSALEFGPEIQEMLSRPKIPLQIEDKGSSLFERKRYLRSNEVRRGRSMSAKRTTNSKSKEFRSLSARIERFGENEFGRRASTSQAPPGRSVSVETPYRPSERNSPDSSA
ncbi:movement protein [polyscias capillovirus 1]|uniref:Movement protein n=1 Tax=polyscias capillovirus 1 TaxID=2945985 RepID=A0AAE9LU91_9VIRU|nr:movement protein [polyscias capillovirus 1]